MENDPSEGSSNQPTSGKIVGGKFKLEDKIGQGSFGMIFKCINIETQELCAIKLEKRNQRHSSMLVREIKVMMEVKNEKGFARLCGYGKEEDYNYVSMTYLGRNLDSLLRKCGGKFKLQCLLNVFEQTLIRVQTLHNRNLIHRDIKPENFVIGYGSNFNSIHLIDFGLAKYYIDSEGNHIPFFEKKGMIGTARYASVNAHLGHEQSRRDDLEGLGYIILYFAKGQLPWQAIHADNKEEKYERIKQMKLTISLDQLCMGLPIEFQQYFQHVKNLEFSQAPNYDYLFKLIDKIRQDHKLENNINIVDWQELPEYRPRKKYQTFTPHTVQQYQNKKINDDMGQVSPRGYLQRSSDQLPKPPQRVQRKANHNHTNLLQIPDKQGTFLLQPSVSNVSANNNTSKMNNFHGGSFMAGLPDKFGTNRQISSSTKINSFADIEKYQEEKLNSHQKLNKHNSHHTSNGKNSQSNHNITINNNHQNNNNNYDKQSNNVSIKIQESDPKKYQKQQQDQQTDQKKSQSQKQQEFYQQSDNMQTSSQDYHKQYPINIFVAKKAYKNGNFP